MRAPCEHRPHLQKDIVPLLIHQSLFRVFDSLRREGLAEGPCKEVRIDAPTADDVVVSTWHRPVLRIVRIHDEY